MFDIGFTELIIVAIVGLLVIGPERLPGAIRTGSAWLGRIKRSFNDIKREVEQELHNDSVMQELKETGQQLKDQTSELNTDLQNAAEQINPMTRSGSALGETPDDKPANDKKAE